MIYTHAIMKPDFFYFWNQWEQTAKDRVERTRCLRTERECIERESDKFRENPPKVA